MAIISQVKDLDARGRLLAQTSGVSTSLVHEDRRISLATVPVNDAPEIISDIELVNVTVHLSAEKPLQRIVFDRRGHSDDYMFTMSAGENETSRQWEVHGLTGAFSEVSP
jgi:hypothetical protein